MKDKRTTRRIAMGLLALSALTLPGRADFSLRMESGTGALCVAASPIPESGALFVYGASTMAALQSQPTVLFQTNTPHNLMLPVSQSGQGFFFASHWPGRAISEFGDPEHASPTSAQGPDVSTEARLQELESLRLASIDTNTAWQFPLTPTNGCVVSGTYGEWRGNENLHVHRGLDLAPTGTVAIVAARSGVVSCRGEIPGLGGFLVLDHGDGWFSRYLCLDTNLTLVAPGQAVARGASLATRLQTPSKGPVHLHFEIRHASGTQAQWSNSGPGSSQDPLQTAGIFRVAAGSRSPEILESGLTRLPPGQIPFVKSTPDAETGIDGPPYLVARFADREPKPGGGEFRLGLRAVSFQAEGMSQAVEIRPWDEASIEPLMPPGEGLQAGFALYPSLHAACPDPLNWHRYWWAWNTAVYPGDPKGPRTVTLIGRDYNSNTVTRSLAFGPEISWTALSNRTFRLTIIAHLGATNNTPALVQPDRYQAEAFRGDGTPMAGIAWEGALPGDHLYVAHHEEASFVFHVPEEEDVRTMRMRVSSVMAPDLRHEITPLFPALADIPAGSFLMGSAPSDLVASWEGPQTAVTLSYPYKMGKYEITQAEYTALMSNNPSYFSGVTNRPVERVTWANAMEYCRRLTLRERQWGCLPEGWSYRLPTEAEWEYACRAGTATVFHYGTALRSGMANFDGVYEYDSTLGDLVNTNGVHLWKTMPVGSYAPNAWGLFDMHGNTWEWCLDWWSSNLPGGTVTDPGGALSGINRSVRGGGWGNDGKYCRSAYRLGASSEYSGNDLGFRVVLTPDTP